MDNEITVNGEVYVKKPASGTTTRKYSFTGKTIKISDFTSHQIQAERDFGDVKKGDIGGWIEKEGNLSHEGEAWVFDHAMVYGNA